MSLFVDDSEPLELVSMPVERIGRFVLHRAGIRNVWQYDDVSLLFSGGRMLLRGKNGAGKSKAMEMLLPFLLDGDTRALDCVRKDRTSLFWLMTDGREPGNHIGYMWLELRAVDTAGNEEFRTLGCGVKASSAARKHTVWFFISNKRVDDGIALDDESGMLEQEAFRLQLEPEEFFTTTVSYARRVATELFGIDDDARYRNLCHLLYELRRPSVGENIEAGQHTKVLTEALPPLDDDLIAGVAQNFDDLTKIREDLARAERTERALATFLDSYRDYARGVLRHRAQLVIDAANEAKATQRNLKSAEGEAQRARQSAETAQDRVDRLDTQAHDAQNELQVLLTSPAYQHLQSINDRKQRVDAYLSAATAAENAADLARNHAEQEADTVTVSAANVDHEATQTRATRRALEPLAVSAGIDVNLLAEPVTITEVHRPLGPKVTTPQPTDSAPRTIDIGVVESAIQRYEADLKTLASHCHHRSTILGTLIKDAEQVEHLDTVATTAEAAAASAQRQLERASLAENQAAATAADQDRRWRHQVSLWLDQARVVCDGTDWSTVGAYSEFDAGLLLTADEVDSLPGKVEQLLAPSHQGVEAALMEATFAKRDADAALAALETQLAQVEARTEKLPEPSPYRALSRDPNTGIPFYAAVEFTTDVDQATAAGIEAALQASGLLDGWVSTEGMLRSATTEDLLLTPSPLPAGATPLSSVLTPATPPDSAVESTTISALLTSIAVSSHPEASSWVDGKGRWRLGVATGAWHKDQVEFIGVTARRQARERELAHINTQILEAQSEVTKARDAREAVINRRDELTRLRHDLPGARELVEALNRLATLGMITAQHRSESEEMRNAAEQARDVETRARRHLSEQATRFGMPKELSTLGELRSAVSLFTQRVHTALGDAERITRALASHHKAIESWQRASDEHQRLATTAAQERLRYHNEAAQLATLEDAVGERAQEVQAKINQAQALLDEAERSLPWARKELTGLQQDRALADDRVNRLHIAVDEADRTIQNAATSLDRILTTPGLSLAAFGTEGVELTTPPEDSIRPGQQLDAYAKKIIDAATGGSEVSEGSILRRYETLSGDSGIAAGYEATQDETDDGIKVFEIQDDTGRQPIAVVAQRLTKEVAEAKSRLTVRQQEVFQRFLLSELGEHLRRQLLDADTLCAAMNESLAKVRTSHGLGVRLDWHLREDAPPEALDAIPMLREAPAIRGEDKNQQLARLLGSLIDAAREADPSASYEVHLHTALDYRNWHTFAIKVIDAAHPRRERNLSNRLAVSQGEQRVLAYLTLFSAASAYFDSLKKRSPRAPRLILLDDAFAKVDEPTHGLLLGLLLELDLDFIITSERVTGCVPGISLEIYECLRDARTPGVALVHTHWDGERATLEVT
ncbi:TIGR02680 family protein [Ferrimicrobium sp.]|uniref:TIGR02680 family protein n=1 Tax=Ferrimicrobium sp. TaxID=2926050 RepID=UPI002605F9C2|nr:TIGR02680 family protein [Ferrimicrobium sp.]